MSDRGFRLTVDTINKNMEYAVRGKMPQEAAKIESAIKKVSFCVNFERALRVLSTPPTHGC